MRSVAGFYLDTGNYLAATMALSTREHGAYLRLLVEAKLHGSVPADDAAIAAILKVRRREWARMAPTVLAYFISSEDGRRLLPTGDHIGRTFNEPTTRRHMDVSPGVWNALRSEVFLRDGHACVYCGTQDQPLECDHVQPVASGGLSTPANLVTACKPCNASKGAKPLAEWGGRA